MKKIKTFEDACKALKLDPKKLPDVSSLPEKHRKALIAHFKLIIIAEALNEGWQPDWSNTDQYKYTPWFAVQADKKHPSGFGLSFHVRDNWDANTIAGSRLCYKSRELAEYAGKHFTELYKDYLLFA